jgi:translation initiation factor IF-3
MVLSARLNQPPGWTSVICKESSISANEFRVNATIRVPEVRLIDAAGENAGVVATREALRMAHEADLDLVEVAPNSVPPV